MKKPDVAIYVQREYAKPAYKTESYNVRAWPGLEMVRDALQRAGVEVGYCSAADVSKYKIVLVSITAACDWHTFIRERLRWPRRHGLVVAGGAGCENVRPFLRWADVFFFGRAERKIGRLVRGLLSGDTFRDRSICYADEFSLRKRYEIDAGGEIYPHEVQLANGRAWTEEAIGCQRRCSFCSYSWNRKHVGGLQGNAGAGNTIWPGRTLEKTIFELDLDRPETWGLDRMRIVGLDGFSARLRKMVAKPITRDMLRRFFRGVGRSKIKPNRLKVYNIVGLPTESVDDWREFVEDLRTADRFRYVPEQWGIELHSTPFRPMPATPCATWPMGYGNYRNRIRKVLRGDLVDAFRGVFYRGRRFWAAESRGTESLSTVILDAIVLRGTEAESDILSRLASSRRFRNASGRDRVRILEAHVDVDRLFGEFTWKTLPTRYLVSHHGAAALQRADEAARRRAGRSWAPAEVPELPK